MIGKLDYNLLYIDYSYFNNLQFNFFISSIIDKELLNIISLVVANKLWNFLNFSNLNR